MNGGNSGETIGARVFVGQVLGNIRLGGEILTWFRPIADKLFQKSSFVLSICGSQPRDMSMNMHTEVVRGAAGLRRTVERYRFFRHLHHNISCRMRSEAWECRRNG